MSIRTCLLLTDSYPYDLGLERTFLDAQVDALTKAFESVVILPTRRGGSRGNVAPSVEVDEGLAAALEKAGTAIRVAMAIKSPVFWDELVNEPRILYQLRRMRRLVGALARATIEFRYLDDYLARKRLDPAQTTAYAFWCDHTAAALAFLKVRHPELLIVARAHGVDIYAERHEPPYLPLRRFTFRKLDRLFMASQHALDYVVTHHPEIADRTELARLGVDDPGFTAFPSTSATRFVLVSCSGMVPVKQLDRIVLGIERAARQRRKVLFEWHHFGDGPEWAPIRRMATLRFPENATATFYGHRPVDEIFNFYRTHPVDAFINTSSSEGGSPVAIMEAISCGIAAIATDVGGNPEIVSRRNGILVSSAGGADEISAAIFDLLDDPKRAAEKRVSARLVWQELFDSKSNYRRFVARLRESRQRVS